MLQYKDTVRQFSTAVFFFAAAALLKTNASARPLRRSSHWQFGSEADILGREDVDISQRLALPYKDNVRLLPRL